MPKRGAPRSERRGRRWWEGRDNATSHGAAAAATQADEADATARLQKSGDLRGNAGNGVLDRLKEHLKREGGRQDINTRLESWSLHKRMM